MTLYIRYNDYKKGKYTMPTREVEIAWAPNLGYSNNFSYRVDPIVHSEHSFFLQ